VVINIEARTWNASEFCQASQQSGKVVGGGAFILEPERGASAHANLKNVLKRSQWIILRQTNARIRSEWGRIIWGNWGSSPAWHSCQCLESILHG
jgi:hypothetical protein